MPSGTHRCRSRVGRSASEQSGMRSVSLATEVPQKITCSHRQDLSLIAGSRRSDTAPLAVGVTHLAGTPCGITRTSVDGEVLSNGPGQQPVAGPAPGGKRLSESIDGRGGVAAMTAACREAEK